MLKSESESTDFTEWITTNDAIAACNGVVRYGSWTFLVE
jgi:hypothetical protein